MNDIDTYESFCSILLDNGPVDKTMIDFKKYIHRSIPILYDMEKYIFSRIIDLEVEYKIYRESMSFTKLTEILDEEGVLDDMIENEYAEHLSCMNEITEDLYDFYEIINDRTIKLIYIYSKLVAIMKRNRTNELFDTRESLRGKFKYGFDVITKRIIQNHNISEALNKDVSSLIGSYSHY
jgi:hypothetical protein